MTYFISRGGQQYGPYAPADLQRYLAQGSILYSDLARTDTMSEWLPLSQLLQPVQPKPAQFTPPVQPMPAVPHGTGPIPPGLHWVLVLVLGMVTGLFTTIWVFVQSNFIKKIDPQSKATLLYALGLVALIAGACVTVVVAILASARLQAQDSSTFGFPIGLGVLMLLVITTGTVLFIAAAFSIRSSMLRYYNTVEPINLRLSGVMTFFFHTLYFQYHFSRIAKWKETGIIYPQ